MKLKDLFSVLLIAAGLGVLTADLNDPSYFEQVIVALWGLSLLVYGLDMRYRKNDGV